MYKDRYLDFGILDDDDDDKKKNIMRMIISLYI